MSDTNTFVFAGKYAISNADGTLVMSVSGNILQLVAGDPDNPLPAQMFNTYGDLTAGFTLQAPNTAWSYVEYTGGYVADKPRGDAACSVFSLVSAYEGSVYIVETVGTTQYYMNAGTGGTLSRIPKDQSTPPASAQFVLQNEPAITWGLSHIVKYKSTGGNPLTGVYLAGQNLSQISFAGSDVSYADFSGGANLDHSNFNGCTAVSAKFDQAILTNWVANGLTFTNCSFAGANFTGASLALTVMKGCILNQANFANAVMNQVDFTNAVMVGCHFQNALFDSAIFNGATLTNADFSLAKVAPNNVDFSGAILIGTNLAWIQSPGTSNAKVIGTDFTKCKPFTSPPVFMNAKLDACNFTGLDLREMVFTRASMQKAKLDGTKLDGVQMPFTDLSFASITGGVSMIGANLSNANLQGAQMPGAQLGAKVILTTLPLSDATLLDQSQVPPDMTSSLHLSSAATVSQVIQPGQRWVVVDGTNTYQVNNSGPNLLVQQVAANTNAAVLTGAYMSNTNLQQANLYAVEMSGVHWYGADANAQGADLGMANLSNSNLRGMLIKQASMQGAQLDYSNLIGTQFNGTTLSPSGSLKPTSFAFSMLQSTVFEALVGTGLAYANLTNSAFCLPDGKGGSLGVPLFTLPLTLKPGVPPTIPTALQTAFNNAGYPLVDCATITAAPQSGVWVIANIDEDDATQVGYGSFQLRLIQQPNNLNYIQVYGTPPLLVQEVNAQGQLQQTQLAFGYTAATQAQMNGETTCPSGMKLKYLSTYLTFEELMTAAQPPKPPACANCWGS